MLFLVIAISASSLAGPQRATLSCAEGAANFPFLKAWVGRFENFIAPIETGSTDGSLFYAVGATTVSKKAAEAWRTERVTLPLEWKRSAGRIETAFLGEVPAPPPGVKPGPGFAPVARESVRPDSSIMGAKRSVVVASGEPALHWYGTEVLKGGPGAGVREASPGGLYGAGSGTPGSWTRLWSLLYTPAELQLLGGCSGARCKVKFDDNELKIVIGSSHQYRLDAFRKVISHRIEEFRSQAKVRAYEGTHLPLDWEDLPISQAFPAKYNTHFWVPRGRTEYGYELLDVEPGTHKPVVGLFSRHCEPRGEGRGSYTACQDVFIYNNHYFDFWARIILFFPWCDVHVALAYETLDIDQIKESRIARILFGSQMRGLLGLVLETRLRHLHMIGSAP